MKSWEEHSSAPKWLQANTRHTDYLLVRQVTAVGARGVLGRRARSRAGRGRGRGRGRASRRRRRTGARTATWTTRARRTTAARGGAGQRTGIPVIMLPTYEANCIFNSTSSRSHRSVCSI
jgi:hypothetical protein